MCRFDLHDRLRRSLAAHDATQRRLQEAIEVLNRATALLERRTTTRRRAAPDDAPAAPEAPHAVHPPRG